jgi:hypothetical protein
VSLQSVLGTGEVYTGFCWGNLRERDHLEDGGVDGWKDGYLRKRMGTCTGLIWQVAVCCESGNELSGSIKCREFLS